MSLSIVIGIFIVVLILLVIGFILKTENDELIQLLKRLIIAIIIVSLIVGLIVSLITFSNKKSEKKNNKHVTIIDKLEDHPIKEKDKSKDKNKNTSSITTPNNESQKEEPQVNNENQKPTTNNNLGKVEIKEDNKQVNNSINSSGSVKTKSSQVIFEEEVEINHEENIKTRNNISNTKTQVENNTQPKPSHASNVNNNTDTNNYKKESSEVKTPEMPKEVVTDKPKKDPVVKDKKIAPVNLDNKVYFLKTGSSDAIIVRSNGRFGLIDTALASKKKKIINSLDSMKVKELDFIILTHAHSDHIGTYPDIMKKYKVKTLYIKKDGAKYPAHEKEYKKLIKIANNKKTNICDVKLSKCQNFVLGNMKFKLYNTKFFSAKKISRINKDRFENVNSIATVATIYGKRIYFAGDIGNYFGYNQETKTAKQIGDVDVYKAAHHGYVTFNNNSKALKNIKPEYTIVTNNKFLSSIAVRRIKKANSKYKKTYYTSNGDVVLTITNKGKISFYQ